MDGTMAWDHVQDPEVKAAMMKIAGNKPVKPGPEGKALFQQALDSLNPDFDSSDGTPATKYAGKSLDMGGGGRSKLLFDKLLAGGMQPDEAKAIVSANAAAKMGGANSKFGQLKGQPNAR